MALTPKQFIQKYRSILVMQASRTAGVTPELQTGGLPGIAGLFHAAEKGGVTIDIPYRSSIPKAKFETNAAGEQVEIAQPDRKRRNTILNDFTNFVSRKGQWYGKGAHGADHDRSGSLVRSPRIPVGGSFHVTAAQIQGAFIGRGLPEDFRAVLQAADLYLAAAQVPPAVKPHLDAGGGTPMTLQQFTNAFLGVDCNGFVGAYIVTHYPERTDFISNSKFSMDAAYKRFVFADGKQKTKLESRRGHYRRVEKIEDVAQGCILIDPKGWDDGRQHISLVERATITGTTATIETAESRTVDGRVGPTSQTGTLTWRGTPLKPAQSSYGYWMYGTRAYKLILKPTSLADAASPV